MSVAVLVVNYHVYEDLDRALSSIEPFLRASDEVVVVDQESDAGQIDDARRRHPRVTFVPTERNVGFAAGANLAARASSAPFLLLLNPDSVMDEPVIERLERYLLDHPRAGIVGPRVLNEDGTVQASARRFPGFSTLFAGRSTWLTRRFPGNWLSAWNLPARQAAAAVAVDWLAGSCLMTRRSLFDALQGFDESFFLYLGRRGFLPPGQDARLGTYLRADRVGPSCRRAVRRVESGARDTRVSCERIPPLR